MKKITFFLMIVLTGCSTNSFKYQPVGSKDMETCPNSNNCIIKTDAGEALFSENEKTAVLLNLSDERELFSENAKSSYYDFLITIANNSDEPINFDPKDIYGYNPDIAIEEYKSRGSSKAKLAIGLVLLGAVAGGLEGAAMVAGDPSIAQLMMMSEADSKRFQAKQKEFANTKISAQQIAPNEIAAGRIIIESSAIAQDVGEIKHQKLVVNVPVLSEEHTFVFSKEVNAQ